MNKIICTMCGDEMVIKEMVVPCPTGRFSIEIGHDSVYNKIEKSSEVELGCPTCESILKTNITNYYDYIDYSSREAELLKDEANRNNINVREQKERNIALIRKFINSKIKLN